MLSQEHLLVSALILKVLWLCRFFLHVKELLSVASSYRHEPNLFWATFNGCHVELVHIVDIFCLSRVVCVGGDGMFSEVLHGLVTRIQTDNGVDQNQPDAELVPCSLRIGIIPAGELRSLYRVKNTLEVWKDERVMECFFVIMVSECHLKRNFTLVFVCLC